MRHDPGSRHSGAACGNGFDAGQNERANRLAQQHHDITDNAVDASTEARVGKASAQ